MFNNYQQNFDENFKEIFFNTFTFSNNDNNNFILLLQKGFYPHEWLGKKKWNIVT